MKTYEINYATKVATITKKTTTAEKKMLERMGLTLVMKKEFARPSYKQIEVFLSYLENGLEMMEKFETMRGLSLHNDCKLIFHSFFYALRRNDSGLLAEAEYPSEELSAHSHIHCNPEVRIIFPHHHDSAAESIHDRTSHIIVKHHRHRLGFAAVHAEGVFRIR